MQLTRMVQTIMRQMTASAEEAAELPDDIHLPLTTHMEIEEIEEQLENKTFESKLVCIYNMIYLFCLNHLGVILKAPQ